MSNDEQKGSLGACLPRSGFVQHNAPADALKCAAELYRYIAPCMGNGDAS